MENIWAQVIVILFGSRRHVPGQLFARIPVTQVSLRRTEGKKGWKRKTLVWCSFAGTSFYFRLVGAGGALQSHLHHQLKNVRIRLPPGGLCFGRIL